MTIASLTIEERIAVALERIATALEQQVLEGIPLPPVAPTVALPPPDGPFPPFPQTPPPDYREEPATAVALGPVPRAPAGVCPVHRTAWRMVPGGISKKTGKPYNDFWVCSTTGCDQRPAR